MPASRDIGSLGDAISGTANVNFDANTLFIDGVNDRVGIGTTTPGGKLHVVGPANSVPLSINGSLSNLTWSEYVTGGVAANYFWNNNGNFYFGTNSNNFLAFGTNNTERARLTADGHFVPATTNTYDLGSSSLRWRNIFTNDLNLSNGIGDYTIVEGEDDLFLYNNKKGKVYKFALIEVSPEEAPEKAQT